MSDGQLVARPSVPASDDGLATLELISQARQSLTAARTLPDIRRVMEAASVAKDAAERAARLFNAERRAAEVVEAATAAANDAAAVRIEAQAKAGELLAQMRESGERQQRGRPQKTSHAATFIDSGGERRSLGSLGVSRSESSRWQQVAAVPQEVRADYVEETKSAKGEVSTEGLLRHAAATRTPHRGSTRRVDHAAIANEAQRQVRKLYRDLLALPGYRPEALVAGLDGSERRYLIRAIDQITAWLDEVSRELAIHQTKKEE